MSLVLETTQLSMGYRTQGTRSVVAEGLDLSLSRGELVCLLGANGVGKSTLLRTLTGMQAALSGGVRLDGHPLEEISARERAQKVAVVLTDSIDIGQLRVGNLVSLGRYPYTDWAGRLRPTDSERVDWAMHAVGAFDLRDRFVDELSDGERQKVMIARALAQDPLFMALDEPTAFLDYPHRLEIMRLLRDLAWNEDRAVLLTTHDLDLAMRMADRLWLLQPDGQLVVGSPEDLVMNGRLQNLFPSADGVTFDVTSGSFQLAAPTGLAMQVEGDGLAAVWATRALSRIGVCVTSEQAVATVLAEGESGAARWTVTHGATVQGVSTLADLVKYVRTEIMVKTTR